MSCTKWGMTRVQEAVELQGLISLVCSTALGNTSMHLSWFCQGQA